LIVGALPWMAFCDAVIRGMTSLLEAGSILQKNALPPVLFPVRGVLGSAVIFSPLLLLVALAYAPYHQFAAPVIALPGLLLLQTILCVLLGYLLAVLAAALRDTVQIVGFLLTVGIYLSPALFPITLFPESWRWALWGNPMTGLMLGYQSVLLKSSWPPAEVWVSTITWIAVMTVLLDGAVRRSKDQLIDWL
jgi:lipopolysaccharide transport system permease protein